MLDETTRLPNGRLFEQQFHEAPRATAIMFLDLDGFKQVNDELGHTITASIGVALDTRTNPTASVEQLIRLADRAMSTAKGKGGNRAEWEYLV